MAAGAPPTLELAHDVDGHLLLRVRTAGVRATPTTLPWMRIGFAGAGNMATAPRALGELGGRAGGDALLRRGLGRAARLAAETGGEAVDPLRDLARASDAVILATKPGALDTAAEMLEGEAKAIVSVLGATSVARLRGAVSATCRS